MFAILRQVLKAATERAPRDNWASLRRKLGPRSSAELNKVVPSLIDRPVFAELVAARLLSERGDVTLVGSVRETDALRRTLRGLNKDVRCLDWTWSGEVNLPTHGRIVVCGLPLHEGQWESIRRLHERFPGRVTMLQELSLPFTVIDLAQAKLGYYLKTMEEIAPHYMGKTFFGPLDELDRIFPLVDKTVIEFGPFDGCQTAGLVSLRVKHLVCIEARAENVIKTMIARYAFQWDKVRIVMDDFHNVTGYNYGRFDLAFVHGVYYHSHAPLLLLENLLTLADHVFLGGFCATDSLPAGEFELLHHQDKTYRVKRYLEGNDYTAGVNRVGYFFHKEDLMRFFQERGWDVLVVSDEATEVTAGNFIRFLARKRQNGVLT